MGHSVGSLVQGSRAMGRLWGGNPPGLEEAVARRQPEQIASMGDVRRMFDGYDTGVRYADHHVGILLNELDRLGVLEETAVILSGDHGETLGELALYCDHATADLYTSRLPMILRWPGLPTGRVDGARHYQIDVAASVLELLGVNVPGNWDGQSFAGPLRRGEEEGRETIVTTHGAHTVQRGVAFDDWWLIKTWHDGWHPYPELMLFDLAGDPHEQRDLVADRPDVVARGLEILTGWHDEAMGSAAGPDPIETILAEGGPWHFRGLEKEYWQRLQDTGRGGWAAILAERHQLTLT
jgi:arylsulfatase A-like enzyme